MMASPSLIEGALRRTTGLVRMTAELLEKADPTDPLAKLLREKVSENKALLGDPENWKDVA